MQIWLIQILFYWFALSIKLEMLVYILIIKIREVIWKMHNSLFVRTNTKISKACYLLGILETLMKLEWKTVLLYKNIMMNKTKLITKFHNNKIKKNSKKTLKHHLNQESLFLKNSLWRIPKWKMNLMLHIIKFNVLTSMTIIKI